MKDHYLSSMLFKYFYLEEAETDRAVESGMEFKWEKYSDDL